MILYKENDFKGNRGLQYISPNVYQVISVAYVCF